MKELLARAIISIDTGIDNIRWGDVLIGMMILVALMLAAFLITGIMQGFKGDVDVALFLKNWARLTAGALVGWRIKPTWRALVRWARAPERVAQALRKQP